MIMKSEVCLFAKYRHEEQCSKIIDPIGRLIKHVSFIALAAGIDITVPRLSRVKDDCPQYPAHRR